VAGNFSPDPRGRRRRASGGPFVVIDANDPIDGRGQIFQRHHAGISSRAIAGPCTRTSAISPTAGPRCSDLVTPMIG